MREFGREYLKDKQHTPQTLQPLMEGTLSPSVRRLIDASQIGFIIPEPIGDLIAPKTANESAPVQGIQGSGAAQGNQNVIHTPSPQLSDNLNNVALGTIPPGESIVIMFQVKINDPFTSASPQVSNQGTVSGNFPSVLTDDPGVAGTANPTLTPINLPAVTVAVSPTSVAEDGAGNLVYTFTRTGTTTGPITVSFNVGGTATFNTDYTQSGAATFTASSGTVTIPTGSLTATVTIDPTADTSVEPNETVILTVTSGTGYS